MIKGLDLINGYNSGPRAVSRNSGHRGQDAAEFKQLLKQRKQASIENTPQSRLNDDLYAACTQLTALFYQQLFKAMRQTVPDDGLLAPQFGQKVFQEMLDAQLAEDAAADNGEMLTDLLYRQLTAAVKPAD